jgi:DNA gyrase inhibitor GyrI
MPVIKKVESGKLLCLEGLGGDEDVQAARSQLLTYVNEKRISVSGEPFTLYYDDPDQLDFNQAHFGVALALAGETFGDGEIVVVTQTVMKVASAGHSGDRQALGATLKDLQQWAREHQFKPQGALRLYYRPAGPDQSGGWLDRVAELQLPVVKTA